MSSEKSLKILHNPDFEVAFRTYLDYKTRKLDDILGSSNEYQERKQYITLACNFALYNKLFKRFDEKLYKNLWVLQKKAPVIQIVGHITFKSESFLKIHCEAGKVKALDPKDMRQYRLDYLRLVDTKYEEKIDALYLRISEWCATMNSPLFSDLNFCEHASENVNNMAKAILNGINLASQVKLLTDDLLLLHFTEHIDMKPSTLFPLMKGLSMIKGVDYEINSKMTTVAMAVPLMKRLVLNQLIVGWNDCLASVEKQPKSVNLLYHSF